MTDDDDLEALREADPVDHQTLPNPDAPAARALFERITMNDNDVSADGGRRRTHPARTPRIVVAVVAAGVLVLAGIGAALLSRGLSDDQRVASTQTTQRTAPSETADPASPGGPITPGGGVIGSCVEIYDLSTLRNREIAFDGTVKGVAGDEVTFTVNDAFKGVDASVVMLKGAETVGGMNTAGPGAPLDSGTRLLVAGDGGFAWSCGFTQPYDAEVAAKWKATLAG